MSKCLLPLILQELAYNYILHNLILQELAYILHNPKFLLSGSVYEKYPSHLHIDLMPRAQVHPYMYLSNTADMIA